MNLKFVLLSHSPRGRVFRHEESQGKICLMFNNITQCFNLTDFYRLKKSVEEINIEEFFGRHAGENKLHVRTDFKDLFFSFSEEEIYELRGLLLTAEFRLLVENNLKNHTN